jgi:branched-chain amino acid transport system substrate-binding protein
MSIALFRKFIFGFALLAVASCVLGAAPVKAYELIIPALEYRTGPYAPSGVPLWTGFSDYLTLLNERDGGIGGIKIKIAVCETAYDTKRGVECYEKHKGEALAVVPGSTGIAYELIPRASVDRVPIVSPGYGRTSSADGRVFPWVFNFPATYWSAASIIMKYVADQEGGESKLKGKKIALLYLNNAYGREPIPILTQMAKKRGFEFLQYPVESPGRDQDETWAQISRDRPDWLLLWGFGSMTQVAVAKAVSIQFPMDHFIGNWWASAESDVQLVGSGADGFLGAALQAPGAFSQVHADILKYVYDAGVASDPSFKPRIGEVLYNRGLASAMWITEAIAKAMEIHGKREVTASDVRDGLEALDITADRLEELGFEGMLSPLKVTCSNHEGTGTAAIQQWDGTGKRWRLVSRFYQPDRDLIDPLLKADSEQYASKNSIAVRNCS